MWISRKKVQEWERAVQSAESVSAVVDALDRMTASQQAQYAASEVKYTEDEKRTAAYALNMCTVSLSQIVDYNDLQILEQEYDAILNNLNLEKIPKDEALLAILKQMLDTITFFRIQDERLAMIEQKYRHKMKNAIWNAVPNISTIIAGGNLASMAFSLVAQVGTGYMNYRRAKSDGEWEMHQEKWQLRLSAIEQFHALRRQLFDTAWRLADTYCFEDQWRLTEKIIRRYNEILMDRNILRRYEGLIEIKPYFEAYPYYWYYLGNAANRLAATYEKDSPSARLYFEEACGYFEKFYRTEQFGILREDLIAATACLEYAELLNPATDMEKIRELIDHAQDRCSSACDVLQLCAIGYLRIGQIQKAEEILRRLVVKEYNTKVNAQLLSGLYIREYFDKATTLNQRERIEKNYLSLKRLVLPNDVQYVLPFPQNEGNASVIGEYIQQQREQMVADFQTAMRFFFEKNAIPFHQCWPVEEIKNDEYYGMSDDCEKLRKQERQLFIRNATESYTVCLKECAFPDNVIDVVQTMYQAIMQDFADLCPVENTFYPVLKEELCNEQIQETVKALYQNSSVNVSIEQLLWLTDQFQYATIRNHFRNEFMREAEKRIMQVTDFTDLGQWESRLSNFCTNNGLPQPEMSAQEAIRSNDSNRFPSVITLASDKAMIQMRKAARDQEKSFQNSPIRYVLFDTAGSEQMDCWNERRKKLKKQGEVTLDQVIVMLISREKAFQDIVITRHAVYIGKGLTQLTHQYHRVEFDEISYEKKDANYIGALYENSEFIDWRKALKNLMSAMKIAIHS